MPRQARIKSSTGIYHIMIRGINKERIFSRVVHKNKIIEIIKNIRDDIEFDVIAYCIMDNHLHLLIKADEDKLETLMKKLNIKYAIYYNKIEKRYGHVFQDRFRSEAVESDKYLLGALRYIHNNPVKAGLTKNILDYPWSSAKDYSNMYSEIVIDKYIKEIANLFRNENEFLSFHSINDDNLYIDTKEEESENTRNIVNNLIEKFVIEYGIIDQSQTTIDKREELAEKLIKLNIISYREIAEICNLSFYKVSEIGKKLKA
ncbi:REP element-mobilizing transposase RayT [Sedimentibacter acidaminivorans]|uniref:REP element-mobilizing transposase RayT n=1 Tax=Sedimentibacter acidaminivorans TaxID=913099 RepID=A0ABS4GF83_9FIRM|nr:transposase [Sedimentibacter acidaminivorans]MBP1926363.1 REP element-mobilizing transposase RayT [Sedimentibacter acidaminivorans]